MGTYIDNHSIPWYCFVFQLPFSTKQFQHPCYTRKGREGAFYMVLNREAPSQGPTPYPFVYISTILTEEVRLLKTIHCKRVPLYKPI